MELRKFKIEFAKAKKLKKLELLAENLKWISKKYTQEFLAFCEKAFNTYKEYLEFESEPEQDLSISLLRIYNEYLRINFHNLSENEFLSLQIEIDEVLLHIHHTIYQAEYYSMLMFLYLQRNDHQKAADYGHKAERLIGQQALSEPLKMFYSNYGLALIYSRENEKAKEILTRGLVRNREGNRFVAEKLHMHLGLLYRNQGDLPSAQNEFLSAKRLHDSSDVSGTVILNINIASVFAMAGDYPKVIEQLEDNFELAASVNDIQRKKNTNTFFTKNSSFSFNNYFLFCKQTMVK